MSNYEVLLQKLNADFNLQYLKIDYPEIIESMKDMNLSFKHMIAILCAAEKDCLKFTQEIERLNLQIQHGDKSSQDLESFQSLTQGADEYKEIVYEIEQKLIDSVERLSQNKMIQLQLNNFENLNYSTALNILIQYIEEKCLHAGAEKIVNQQLKEQMIKCQQKNFFLQVENMKMLGNLNPKDQNKIKGPRSRQSLKLRVQGILSQLWQQKKELQQIKETLYQQYNLLFQQDLIVDKILTSSQFTRTYSKLVNQFRNQQSIININGQVKQGLLASQQMNTNEIAHIIEKMQKKFIAQMTKTACRVTANLEEIIRLNIRDQNYLAEMLNNTQTNFNKCIKINKMMQDFSQQKDNLGNQIRLFMESLIFQVSVILIKLNEENMKLKLIQLTTVLEKSVKRQNQSSLESLKSIQYK